MCWDASLICVIVIKHMLCVFKQSPVTTVTIFVPCLVARGGMLCRIWAAVTASRDTGLGTIREESGGEAVRWGAGTHAPGDEAANDHPEHTQIKPQQREHHLWWYMCDYNGFGVGMSSWGQLQIILSFSLNSFELWVCWKCIVGIFLSCFVLIAYWKQGEEQTSFSLRYHMPLFYYFSEVMTMSLFFPCN